MSLIYAEQRNDNETTLSGLATEDIPPGDLVTVTASGAELADANDHDRIDGIALNLEAGDHIARHPLDYEADVDDFVYQPAGNKDSHDLLPNEDDRVPVGGRFDGAAVYPRTVADTSGSLTAPSINYGDVVGVVDTSVGDAPNDPGAVVEEGYTNGATTFNRSNGNFLPLGRARGIEGGSSYPVTSFDTVLAMQVIRDAGL